MASIFAVTAASDHVRLDAQGRGRVTFTVTNTGSETLRARARAVPAAGTDASWLTVSEPAERRMPADGVEQHTVEVAVPAGTPAGHHSFRLDVDAEENPDEIFTQGPSVAFEVAASEKPEKPFPWWILILVAGLLVVGGVAALLLSGGPPGLNEACDDECAEGLVCDESTDTCLGDAGFAGCTDDSDCRGELICDMEEGTEGVCASPPIPGLNQACEDECAEGLICDESTNTCLGEAGFTGCTDDRDCRGELVCRRAEGASEGVCTRPPEPEPPAVLNGTYTIQHKINRRYLDAYEGKDGRWWRELDKDYALVTRDWQNNDSQKWIINPLGNDTYTLRQKSSNRYVDAHEGSRDYALVGRDRRQTDGSQDWIIKPTQGDATFTIQQKKNMRYVDAHTGEDRDFGVVTRNFQGDDSQRWIIKKED